MMEFEMNCYIVVVLSMNFYSFLLALFKMRDNLNERHKWPDKSTTSYARFQKFYKKK